MSYLFDKSISLATRIAILLREEGETVVNILIAIVMATVLSILDSVKKKFVLPPKQHPKPSQHQDPKQHQDLDPELKHREPLKPTRGQFIKDLIKKQ